MEDVEEVKKKMFHLLLVTVTDFTNSTNPAPSLVDKEPSIDACQPNTPLEHGEQTYFSSPALHLHYGYYLHHFLLV